MIHWFVSFPFGFGIVTPLAARKPFCCWKIVASVSFAEATFTEAASAGGRNRQRGRAVVFCPSSGYRAIFTSVKDTGQDASQAEGRLKTEP